MFRLLIQNDAVDVNGLIHFWETPLIHAVRTGNFPLLAALLRRPDIRVNARDIRSECVTYCASDWIFNAQPFRVS